MIARKIQILLAVTVFVLPGCAPQGSESSVNLPETRQELATAQAALETQQRIELQEKYSATLDEAQASLDCWQEKADSNLLFMNCRSRYYAAMRTLARHLYNIDIKEDKSTVGQRSQIVFFEFDSSNLDIQARVMVDGIIADITPTPGGSYEFSVNGHTDRAGPERYNMELSHRRAQSVLRALVEKGIPERLIRAYGFGETDPLVPTRDGVADQRNRRVEIFIVND